MSAPVARRDRPPVPRDLFTATLLTRLRAMTGKPVGDGIIPAHANWIGEPNAPGSSFVPYVVLSEIVASHSSGPIGESQADWQLPYLVESFGVTREQCSAMAALVRSSIKLLHDMRITSVAGVGYGVQQVRIDSLGSPQRVDQAEPPIWHGQDGVTLWVGKGS